MACSSHEAISDVTCDSLSQIDIAAIASRLPVVLRGFPRFEFAARHYCLISDACADAIRIHITNNLANLPLCRVSLALLMDPATSQTGHDAIVGSIDVKLPAGHNNGAAESARTFAVGAITGANVQASGLAQLYFAALSVQIAQFTWDAVHLSRRAVVENAGESLITSHSLAVNQQEE